MTAEAADSGEPIWPMTPESRDRALGGSADEDLMRRAKARVDGGHAAEERLVAKLAEQRATAIMRIHDSAGEAPLRDDLLDFQGLLNLPSPEWLVPNLLPEVGLCFLTGQPGTFKSFVALQVAAGVATGTDVFGGEALWGDVLYIAAEGAPGQKLRGEAQVMRLGDAAAGMYARFRLLRRPVDLLNERHIDQLLEIISERETRLVVVDTLARCTPGADENNATAMGLAIAGLSRLKDAGDGRAVLVVHHAVKAAGGAPLRGSGALNGAADTVFLVARGQGSPFIEVTNTKQKDAEEREAFTLEFVRTGSSGVLQASSFMAAAQHKVQAGGHRLDMLVVLVMSMDGPTIKDLIEATGIARTTLGRDLNELISRGEIVKKAVDGVQRYYKAEADE